MISMLCTLTKRQSLLHNLFQSKVLVKGNAFWMSSLGESKKKQTSSGILKFTELSKTFVSAVNKSHLSNKCVDLLLKLTTMIKILALSFKKLSVKKKRH